MKRIYNEINTLWNDLFPEYKTRFRILMVIAIIPYIPILLLMMCLISIGEYIENNKPPIIIWLENYINKRILK